MQRSPQTEAERQLVIETLRSVVGSLAKLIGPATELVLHDLQRPEASVVAIANGHITQRSIGSAIFSGPFGDDGLQVLIDGTGAGEPVALLSDYKTTLADGRELDSMSLLFRTDEGRAFAAFCANVDRQRMRQLRDLLSDWLGEPEQHDQEVRSINHASIDEVAARIIEDSIASVGARSDQLTMEERSRAVQAMQERGLFLVRQSVELAAERLGVTRHTIYNDLERSKNNVKYEHIEAR